MVVFIADDQSDLLFPTSEGILPWQPILAKSPIPFICRTGVPKRNGILLPEFVVQLVLPFRNAMDYWNADGRINSGDDHAIPDINLVGF